MPPNKLVINNNNLQHDHKHRFVNAGGMSPTQQPHPHSPHSPGGSKPPVGAQQVLPPHPGAHPHGHSPTPGSKPPPSPNSKGPYPEQQRLSHEQV